MLLQIWLHLSFEFSFLSGLAASLSPPPRRQAEQLVLLQHICVSQYRLSELRERGYGNPSYPTRPCVCLSTACIRLTLPRSANASCQKPCGFRIPLRISVPLQAASPTVTLPARKIALNMEWWLRIRPRRPSVRTLANDARAGSMNPFLTRPPPARRTVIVCIVIVRHAQTHLLYAPPNGMDYTLNSLPRFMCAASATTACLNCSRLMKS